MNSIKFTYRVGFKPPKDTFFYPHPGDHIKRSGFFVAFFLPQIDPGLNKTKHSIWNLFIKEIMQGKSGQCHPATRSSDSYGFFKPVWEPVSQYARKLIG